MRKILSLIVVVLCAISSRAADYTEYLTAERGFTEVTSTAGLLTGNYYYILVSAENPEFYVGVGPYQAKPGWAPEATISMRYKSFDGANPLMDDRNFYTIETLDSYIGFRNLFYSHSLFQTNEGESWIYVNAFLYETEMSIWDALTPTYQNGYWKFEEGKYSGNFLGPWSLVVAENEPLAGNRTDAVGDEAGHFRLFRISKSDFETKVYNARVEYMGNANETNPIDATWLIKNPSFERDREGWTIYRGNPTVVGPFTDLYWSDYSYTYKGKNNKTVTMSGTSWITNYSNIKAKDGDGIEYTVVYQDWGDTRVWDYSNGTYTMTNGEGNYLFNAFSWWATEMGIGQTITNMPNGMYELSATFSSHAPHPITFYANEKLASGVGAGAETGVPMSIRLNINNGKLTFKTISTIDWWTEDNDHNTNEHWKQGFLKADNYQLRCLGLFDDDILPLPNNTTTVLAPNQWYYYDAGATARYILTGNLSGMKYCTGQLFKSGNVEMPTKSEMGFPAGRVFFKTTRSDATLKVEPAHPVASLTVASMNVDGLPLTLEFPLVGEKDINPDGPGSTGTGLIGSYITNRQYDLIAFQEDFNYDNNLRNNMGAYTFGTTRSSITSGIVSTRPADTDGLQFAARNAAASFANESITQFSSSYSEDVVQVSLFNQNVNIVDGNSLIKKGFRYYEVTLANGEKIDVFIAHTDAGTTNQSSSDPYVVSRQNQMKQIANAILAKGNPDRPKLFMGDTNCRWTREDLNTYFVNILSGTYDVGDAWVEVERNGVYPTVGQGTISDEVVDKFFYINPKGNNVMKLTPFNFLLDAEHYVKTDGTPLSDHTPVVAQFGLGLYEEVDNHVQTDIVGDDGWDMADLSALVNILVGKTDSSYNMDAADVNGDGSITLADLTELVNIMP